MQLSILHKLVVGESFKQVLEKFLKVTQTCLYEPCVMFQLHEGKCTYVPGNTGRYDRG